MSLEQLQEARTLDGIRELVGHFFQPILKECPACGEIDCPHWTAVHELIGPEAERLPAPLARQLGGMLR